MTIFDTSVYQFITPSEALERLKGGVDEFKPGDEVEIGVHGVYEQCKYIGKGPSHYVGYNSKGEIIYAINCRRPKSVTMEEELERLCKAWQVDRYEPVKQIMDIINRHTKQPTDQEILEYWVLQSKDLHVREATIDLVRHFLKGGEK